MTDRGRQGVSKPRSHERNQSVETTRTKPPPAAVVKGVPRVVEKTKPGQSVRSDSLTRSKPTSKNVKPEVQGTKRVTAPNRSQSKETVARSTIAPSGNAKVVVGPSGNSKSTVAPSGTKTTLKPSPGSEVRTVKKTQQNTIKTNSKQIGQTKTSQVTVKGRIVPQEKKTVIKGKAGTNKMRADPKMVEESEILARPGTATVKKERKVRSETATLKEAPIRSDTATLEDSTSSDVSDVRPGTATLRPGTATLRPGTATIGRLENEKDNLPVAEVSPEISKRAKSAVRQVEGIPIDHIEDYGSSSLKQNEIDSGFTDFKEMGEDTSQSAPSEYDYEEDFEDYESDFEEMSESEEESQEESSEEVEVEKPVIIENRGPTGILKTVKPETQFFNFANAEKEIEKRSQAAKAKTRGNELLELITLDKQSFNIFNSPPVNYDFFIELFGQKNRKQVYVETELKEDQLTQTDDCQLLDKWTQMPSKNHLAVGGDTVVLDNNMLSATNGIQLNNFLVNSSRLIVQILEEEASENLQSNFSPNIQKIPFSQGFLKINTSNMLFLEGTIVSSMCFSNDKTSYMLTSHLNENEPLTESFICVWNMKNISDPEYILRSVSQPLKSIFNPGLPTVVFSGMSDGSISLWNLREQRSLHSKGTLVNNFLFRNATYSTAAVQAETGHHSPIIDIFVASHDSFNDSSLDSQLCHLLSLEELGVLHIWAVVALHEANVGGSQSDLGLAPGGQLKLVKSSTLQNICSPLSEILMTHSGIEMCCFAVHPNKANELFIATDVGVVCHCTSNGGTVVPRFYGMSKEDLVPVKINCIAFNSFLTDIFAIGCGDGSLRIFNSKSEREVLKCICSEGPSSLIQLEWSAILPTVLIAQTISSEIQIWDIAKSSSEPIMNYHFKDNDLQKFCLHSQSLDGDRWLGHMGISMTNGLIYLHKLSNELVSVSSDELFDLLAFMAEL